MNNGGRRNPFEQLDDLITEGNRRTLVLRGSDRTYAAIPLGYGVIATGALLLVAAPVVVIGAGVLYATGGSVAVEEPMTPPPPAPQPPPEPPAAPSDQQ